MKASFCTYPYMYIIAQCTVVHGICKCVTYQFCTKYRLNLKNIFKNWILRFKGSLLYINIVLISRGLYMTILKNAINVYIVMDIPLEEGIERKVTSYLRQWTQLMRLHGRWIAPVQPYFCPEMWLYWNDYSRPCSRISWVLLAQIPLPQTTCHSQYKTYYFMLGR